MQSIKFPFHFFLSYFYFILLKIRIEIIKVLIDFYQKIPTAKYYEVASFNYKHGRTQLIK